MKAKSTAMWNVAHQIDVNPHTAFAMGVMTGLVVADRHPEVVGEVIAQLREGADGHVMPDGLYELHEKMADDIALATEEETWPRN